MIKIEFKEREIVAKGHADYCTDGGEDIVCEAFTCLCYTLINAIEDATGQLPRHEIRGGYFSIVKEQETEITRVLFRAFYIGVRLLAYTYPENVKIV